MNQHREKLEQYADAASKLSDETIKELYALFTEVPRDKRGDKILLNITLSIAELRRAAGKLRDACELLLQ